MLLARFTKEEMYNLLKEKNVSNPFVPCLTCLNSHDKDTYSLMVTGKRLRPACSETKHATSHAKAGLVPKRHQAGSPSELECVAHISDGQHIKIRVALAHKHSTPKQKAPMLQQLDQHVLHSLPHLHYVTFVLLGHQAQVTSYLS